MRFINIVNLDFVVSFILASKHNIYGTPYYLIFNVKSEITSINGTWHLECSKSIVYDWCLLVKFYCFCASWANCKIPWEFKFPLFSCMFWMHEVNTICVMNFQSMSPMKIYIVNESNRLHLNTDDIEMGPLFELKLIYMHCFLRSKILQIMTSKMLSLFGTTLFMKFQQSKNSERLRTL